MRDRSEWIKKPNDGPVKIGKKTYHGLVEFVRPCVSCGEPFSIFVTAKIAAGHADSNSFGLKNCELHRRNKSAAEAKPHPATEMANNVMKQELEGLYAQVASLNARLAQYELQPAMERVASAPLTFPWGKS